MTEPIREYLVRKISEHEHRAKEIMDLTTDLELPANNREYWRKQSHEHTIKAGTHRKILRALDWGLVKL